MLQVQTQFYTFTGMSPYQLITVTITATNGGGTSEPSNEVSGRTYEAGTVRIMCNYIYLVPIYQNCFTAPGRVEIIDIISISDTTLTVTWNPPIQPNVIITGYEVVYSVYGDDAENISIPVTNDINTINITDLRKLSVKKHTGP